MASTSEGLPESASRSADFWFRDGSIVLAVENTHFRVHQTILANHSEVFTDIFNFPQPDIDTNAQELIDGCPVVTMHDRAGDFDDLLKAIYHPGYFEKLSPTADLDIVLSFIGGILRLSTKYIIHELRKRCVAILVTRFPTSYQEYMASMPRPYTPFSSKTPNTADPTVPNDWTNALTFTFVPTLSTSLDSSGARYRVYPHSNLQPTSASSSQQSHQHATPQHPSSSSSQQQPSTSQTAVSSSQSSSNNSQHHHSRSRRSSRQSHHHDRDRDKPAKHKEPDASPPKPKGSSIMRAIILALENNVHIILPYAYYLLARTSEPRRYLSHTASALSWHQKTIILVGRTYLHTAEISMSHSFLLAFEAAPDCLSPSSCKTARGPLIEWALFCTAGRGPEPLRPWDRWEKLGVCPMCITHSKKRHERGRIEVWDRLPEFFDLGGWSRLRESQEV